MSIPLYRKSAQQKRIQEWLDSKIMRPTFGAFRSKDGTLSYGGKECPGPEIRYVEHAHEEPGTVETTYKTATMTRLRATLAS